ncbi:hypothetical protein ACISK3_09220 [Morganella morganii]|nr:hypothetical protein [Morganella morganii]
MTEEYEHASIRVEMASDATIRDYFAAKAMQGFFASGSKANIGTRYSEEMEYLAIAFYSMADAMLRAREK